MKNTNYEHLYSVENTELAQAAKKCVRIFFLMDIHPEFIISDTKLQARLACKEALALLKAYKIALNEIKKKLTISKREMSFFLYYIDNQINKIERVLVKYHNSAEIKKEIASIFPSQEIKYNRNIMFNILLKWCFSANYERDSEKIIQEKLVWTQVFCETLENVLYDKKIAICLYKKDIQDISHLLRDHFDNLRTLLMSDDEIQKEIEIAERFGKKTDFSDFVLAEKR